MAYTGPELEAALKEVEMLNFGVESLFSKHRVYRDDQSAEAFAALWPRLPLETRIGKIACIFGPGRSGPLRLICRAYYDLCTKGGLQIAAA